MTDFRRQAERHLILIEGGPPSNYSAWSPDLAGCVATGQTLEECELEMREAIAFHLDGLAKEGESLPEPRGPGSTSSERRPSAGRLCDGLVGRPLTSAGAAHVAAGAARVSPTRMATRWRLRPRRVVILQV